jgi:hypothetical protein
MNKSMKRSTITNNNWYKSMLAGNPAYTDFELISTQLVGTAVASVTFDTSSLASTYRHLQIRMVSKALNDTNYRLNGDTANNYSYHAIYGGIASVTVFAEAPINRGYITFSNAALADGYSAAVLDLVDAFSTSKNKTVRVMSGHAEPSNNFIFLASGHYRSLSATSSITLFGGSGGGNNLVAGSRLSLYGIKG